MKPVIAVVDYEMGNLHSVAKALELAGARVQVTSSPALIRKAKAVVLPGVGAFGEAAKRLQRLKLIDPLWEVLSTNKPFLGICLGLQLLFERSEESPRQKGLGFLKGTVKRFKLPKSSALKVPHMGWNTLQNGPAKTPVLSGLRPGGYVYFVHSFYPDPVEKTIVATTTLYPTPFASSVAQGRLYACQFHPEKSGAFGQRMLKNFVREVSSCL